MLLVFDAGLAPEEPRLPPAPPRPSSVALFPLASDAGLLRGVLKRAEAWAGGPVETVDAAVLVEEEAAAVRRAICRWSADLGRSKVRGRSLRELFGLGGVSGWWFGLLSEKNPLKTDAFLRLAQLRALRRALKERGGPCLIAVANPRLAQALARTARGMGIEARRLETGPAPRSEGEAGLGRHLLSSLALWLRWLRRGISARRALGPRRARRPAEGSLLFASYFPAAEPEALERGEFKNRYAAALQDKLKELEIPVAWIWMYVPLDGRTPAEALELAATFLRNGERGFFLEEFLSLGDAARALRLWARQVVLALRLYPAADLAALLAEPFSGPECEHILRPLWFRSFCGQAAMEGILSYLAFRRIFRELRSVRDCLYYAEMHAWEKALNAAGRLERPDLRSIGFQHGSVLSNFFNYFHDPSETREEGPDALPLPKVFAADGELPRRLLSAPGYPGFTQVEAVRYLHLDRWLSGSPAARSGKPVLVVAGSIHRRESLALASLARAAFSGEGRFRVRFKGHPGMPFEELFRELGLDPGQEGFELAKGDAAGCLQDAWAVLAGTSGLAIEALAFGCEAIVPVFPDAMPMSPLADFPGFFHKVFSSAELREAMVRIAGGLRLHSVEEYRGFVRSYWDIDPALPKWEALLLRRGRDEGGRAPPERRDQP